MKSEWVQVACLLVLALALFFGVRYYVSVCEEECFESGGTLVRGPLGGLVCVKAPVLKYGRRP